MVTLACLCAAVGLFAISSAVLELLNIWRTDDLRSMGLVVPFVSFALILRSWRQIGWEAEGSWWGFTVLAGLAALLFLHDQTLLMVLVNKTWLFALMPLPLVAVAYAAGMVLLFGGKRLLRQAWFGVAFMAMVIPVPHTFTRMVDLPLQHASASVARAFAHALGQQLTEDKLRLMFTPDFGMFIAPGCNGIRGAVTLGLAAVVVSYVYRFRWFIYAPVVAGAVLLGYLFNFLRLCLLVVYYKIALPYPWLQQRATSADFLIGGALFLCALTFFFTVANRLRNDSEEMESASLETPPSDRLNMTALTLRVVAVCCVAAVFGFDDYSAHAMKAQVLTASRSASLPQQLGRYTLLRTWDDTLPSGTVVYRWGEYAVSGDSGPHVALGISPVFDLHDAEICHLARGENPVYHGQLATVSKNGVVDLTIASYNDGASQWVEGSTICDATECQQFSETTQHVSVIYDRPHRELPLTAGGTRTVPVLLRLNTTDIASPDYMVRPMLVARMQNFLQNFNLLQVTQPYSITASAQ